MIVICIPLWGRQLNPAVATAPRRWISSGSSPAARYCPESRFIATSIPPPPFPVIAPAKDAAKLKQRLGGTGKADIASNTVSAPLHARTAPPNPTDTAVVITAGPTNFALSLIIRSLSGIFFQPIKRATPVPASTA